MLWRNRSWLARLAITASALAVALGLLTVLSVALPDGQASLAAFVYCIFVGFAAACLWVLVAVRLGVRVLLRRD